MSTGRTRAADAHHTRLARATRSSPEVVLHLTPGVFWNRARADMDVDNDNPEERELYGVRREAGRLFASMILLYTEQEAEVLLSFVL